MELAPEVIVEMIRAATLAAESQKRDKPQENELWGHRFGKAFESIARAVKEGTKD